MSWAWIFLKADGSLAEQNSVAGRQIQFTSQSDAETWIGEAWRELAAADVEAVTLEEDGNFVYGPMSLDPTDQPHSE